MNKMDYLLCSIAIVFISPMLIRSTDAMGAFVFPYQDELDMVLSIFINRTVIRSIALPFIAHSICPTTRDSIDRFCHHCRGST